MHDQDILKSCLSICRYPAQEHVGGDAKIPTIIYYDEKGAVRDVGAEALAFEDWVIEAEDGQKFFKAEWYAYPSLACATPDNGFRFKLHLFATLLCASAPQGPCLELLVNLDICIPCDDSE